MPNPITDSLAYLREADQTTVDEQDTPGGRTYEIVRAWHNDVHSYGFEQCDQQPCHAINRPPA